MAEEGGRGGGRGIDTVHGTAGKKETRSSSRIKKSVSPCKHSGQEARARTWRRTRVTYWLAPAQTETMPAREPLHSIMRDHFLNE